MNEAAPLKEVRGSGGWLTMNRPGAMNSINVHMIGLYESYLPEIADDDGVRVMVISGSGRAFCAGMDLKQIFEGIDVPPGENYVLDRLCDNVLCPPRYFPKPVRVCLNGIALAGGLETVMCADLVEPAESAKLGDAHANFVVYPGASGAAVLSRLMLLNVAKYH